MKEVLRNLFFSEINIVDMIFTILSLVSAVIGIVQEVSTNRKKEQRSWIWKIVILISVVVLVNNFIKINFAEVPDVRGYSYENACEMLSERGLRYSLEVDNGRYVTDQMPVAGDVVRRGEEVVLITENIGNNKEVISRWEESINAQLGQVQVCIESNEITLLSNGKTVECVGEKVDNYKVLNAYLIEENSGVIYDDYKIEDAKVVFENIPKGINFQLYLLLDGYEEFTSEVCISSQNSIDGNLVINCVIDKVGEEMVLPTFFYVADGDYSTPNNVRYLSNVKLWVDWTGNNMPRGDYYTNQDGRFEYMIVIDEDRVVVATIHNPFGDGVDYECELTLYAPAIGEANNQSIIFLKRDGSCEAIGTAEYFSW